MFDVIWRAKLRRFRESETLESSTRLIVLREVIVSIKDKYL